MARNGAKGKRNGNGKKGNGNAVPRIRDVTPLFRVVPNMDHKFVRTWDYGKLLSAAADQGYAFAWTFDSFTGFADFTALYDMYRIDAVECIWELVQTSATAKASAIMPIVLAWPDYDDATAPASLLVADQVSQMERLNLSEARPSVRRAIVPRVPLNAGVLSVSQQKQWIDMANTNITHYGVKFWVKNFNLTTEAATGASLAVTFRVHFTCRNPR